MFVTASNGQFSLNGVPFRFVACNEELLLVSGDSSAAILQKLANAKNAGFSVVRILCVGETDQAVPSSTYPVSIRFGHMGEFYNPNALAKLDYIVQQAGLLGLKLIVSLGNKPGDVYGMYWYCRWNDNHYGTDLLQWNSSDGAFVARTVINDFKSYIQAIVTRTNALTHIAYRDDPAIMAWECCNEASCYWGDESNPNTLQSSRVAQMTAWYTEIASFIKTLDHNHLVGTGGIQHAYSLIAGDPVYHAGSASGTDFLSQHAIAAIDYCDTHLYPANDYQTSGSDCTLKWASAQAYAAQLQEIAGWAASLGKPLISGEFGIDRRNTVAPFYPRPAYLRQAISQLIQNGWSGVVIWDYRYGQQYTLDSTGPTPDGSSVPALNVDDSALIAWINNFNKALALQATLSTAMRAVTQAVNAIVDLL